MSLSESLEQLRGLTARPAFPSLGLTQLFARMVGPEDLARTGPSTEKTAGSPADTDYLRDIDIAVDF